MRWFIDSEFAEDGQTIKLISIALVSEGVAEYHRVLADGWSPDDCNDWVKANVLPHLPPATATRAQVAEDLRELLLRDGKPEVVGYFADYDWVALCQLFGTMMDLPNGFPFFCIDLKQEMVRLGVKREQMPAQEGTAHDALADARWIRDGWLWLREYEKQKVLREIDGDDGGMPRGHEAVRLAIQRKGRIKELQLELERERQRLAACGVAARGLLLDVLPEYDSDSLTAVRELRAQQDRQALLPEDQLVRQLLATFDGSTTCMWSIEHSRLMFELQTRCPATLKTGQGGRDA